MPQLGEIKKSKDLGYRTPKGKGRGMKYIWVACIQCGKERWVAVKDGKPKYQICGSCRNRNRFKDFKGLPIYRLIRLQADDPFYPMADSHSCVKEHRLIMAQHLGRCLTRSEVVHHLNGKGVDNSLSNLQLLSSNGKHIAEHLRIIKESKI